MENFRNCPLDRKLRKTSNYTCLVNAVVWESLPKREAAERFRSNSLYELYDTPTQLAKTKNERKGGHEDEHRPEKKRSENKRKRGHDDEHRPKKKQRLNAANKRNRGHEDEHRPKKKRRLNPKQHYGLCDQADVLTIIFSYIFSGDKNVAANTRARAIANNYLPWSDGCSPSEWWEWRGEYNSFKDVKKTLDDMRKAYKHVMYGGYNVLDEYERLICKEHFPNFVDQQEHELPPQIRQHIKSFNLITFTPDVPVVTPDADRGERWSNPGSVEAAIMDDKSVGKYLKKRDKNKKKRKKKGVLGLPKSKNQEKYPKKKKAVTRFSDFKRFMKPAEK